MNNNRDYDQNAMDHEHMIHTVSEESLAQDDLALFPERDTAEYNKSYEADDLPLNGLSLNDRPLNDLPLNDLPENEAGEVVYMDDDEFFEGEVHTQDTNIDGMMEKIYQNTDYNLMDMENEVNRPAAPAVTPSETPRPVDAAGIVKPASAARPSGMASPAGAVSPSGAARPTSAARPSGSARPAGAVSPSGAARSASAARPSGTARSDGTTRPVGTERPESAGRRQAPKNGPRLANAQMQHNVQSQQSLSPSGEIIPGILRLVNKLMRKNIIDWEEDRQRADGALFSYEDDIIEDDDAPVSYMEEEETYRRRDRKRARHEHDWENEETYGRRARNSAGNERNLEEEVTPRRRESRKERKARIQEEKDYKEFQRFQKQKEKERRKKKRHGHLALILILLLISPFLYIFIKIGGMNEGISLKDTAEHITQEIKEDTQTGAMAAYTNIALFGVDSTEDSLDSGNNRTDVMIIASIEKLTGNIKLVSVYRDTYVDIGNGNYQKANAAYAFGGPEQAVQMLNTNFDLNITDYVTIGFDGIASLIDAVGGVEIDVQEDEISHLNNYQTTMSQELNMEYVPVTAPGLQTLNGLQSTAYCRIRYTDGGDFQRTNRQKEVLTKAMQKLKTSSPIQLASIANMMMDKVKTSMNTAEIALMAAQGFRFNVIDQSGVPLDDHRTIQMVNDQSCVVPVTLNDNVQWLHEYLFLDTDFAPSATVQAISTQIQANTGT